MNTKTTTYMSTALIIGGFLLISLAWNGAASEFLVDKQVPFMVSGGLGGIGMIMCGCTLAIAQELRKAAAKIAGGAVGAPTSSDAPIDPFADTLPEPRDGSTGSSIVRDDAPSVTVS